MKTYRVKSLGIPIDICDNYFEYAIKLHQNNGGMIITLNTEIACNAINDKELKKAICSAELVIPESIGIVLALMLKGLLVQKTPGIDISWRLIQHAEKNNWVVAIIGGTNEVINKTEENLLSQFPNLRLNLVKKGYNNKTEWEKIERNLFTLKPDLVLVALGSPLQEKLIIKFRKDLPGLWIGVGGSFDIWAGMKKRAPLWMRFFHLEWLFRLIKEPKRLRRTVASPCLHLAIIRSLKKL